MKTVGIIGGLGPLAGAYFYTRLVECTPAENDEGHIPVVLVSNPAIPSRIAHLSGTGASPVPKLKEVCHRLVQAGAEFIALPSTTTSIYLPELVPSVPVPMVSLLEEVAMAIQQVGYQRVGILGTTPTKTYAVYDEAFRERGLTPVYPDDDSQQDVMRVILAVKAASQQTDADEAALDEAASWDSLRARIADVASRPWAADVDAVLLGCTELPVLFPGAMSYKPIGVWQRPVFSSTEVLARAIVRRAMSDL